MRVLVVSHPALASESGAAQVALHLAEALRERGHDALAWSPEPLPSDTRGWNLWLRQRAALEAYAAAHGPFDVIEMPAISASRELLRHGRLVTRSVQPELRYLTHELTADFRSGLSPRPLVNAALGAWRARAIVGGWRRARLVLCLGSLERDWMLRRYPRWAGKLGLYFNTPGPQDQAAFAGVRKRRTASAGDAVRFLWMGRWTSHKGPRRLLRWFRERPPADTLTLAGCGPRAERDIPDEWLRSGRVRLMPSFVRAGLPALLAEHDAGLFTSTVEGWGLSLNEMLESGLPVFATEAGGVADLRPFFPASLRPFPPPARIDPAAPEDLEENGYFERFTWKAIAAEWERQVLAALGSAGDG